jgi:hypothetical protein
MVHKRHSDKKAVCGIDHENNAVYFYWDEVTCPLCLYHHPNNISNRLHDIAINQAIETGYQLAIDTLKKQNCVHEADLLFYLKDQVLDNT